MTSSPTPAVPPDARAREVRLRMFLEILQASCGQADASDYRWNWINAFCGEHEGYEPDTFNTAHDVGYTTVSHDSDTDSGIVRLTDAGRAYLATPPASDAAVPAGEVDAEQRAGDDFDAEERWIAAYKRLLRADDRHELRWDDSSIWEDAEKAWRKHGDFLTPEKAYARDEKGLNL